MTVQEKIKMEEQNRLRKAFNEAFVVSDNLRADTLAAIRWFDAKKPEKATLTGQDIIDTLRKALSDVESILGEDVK
jgi:hypothetical protein